MREYQAHSEWRAGERHRCMGLLLTAAVLACCMTGCSREAKEVAANIFSCFFLVVFVAVVFLVVGLAINAWETHRRRRLQDARQAYPPAARAVEAWLPQCREIILEEGRHGRLFQEGSPSSTARDKSLRLIQEALEPAQLLYSDDITEDRYRAVHSLQELQSCCRRCREVNLGSAIPTCLALNAAAAQRGHVDLQFQLAARENQR